MRILVCGSRNWGNETAVRETLDLELAILKDGPMSMVIIEGGAKGADSFAAKWAKERAEIGVVHKCFPANWDRYGKRAGFMRNQQMLDEGKPDLVIAFWDGKSRGTAMMIDLARQAGVMVKVWDGVI